MKGLILSFLLFLPSISIADETLRTNLEKTYTVWRDSMVKKDARIWQQITAEHRQVEVKNRIFNLPAPPPLLSGLKFLTADQKGRTAKAAYFGKIDFGVGGEPTENLLVLSFIQSGDRFLYDKADFVNLTALPDVREELVKGDIAYLKGIPEAQPSGVIPPIPAAVQPATTIAKVYVFCPGREVEVLVNKVSKHKFINAKEAETVIGGARAGLNEVQYAIRKLDEGTGKEALTIRVYLLSEVAGVKPIKALEYQIEEKGTPAPYGTINFDLNQELLTKLKGK
jgi:hypothetical protein